MCFFRHKWGKWEYPKVVKMEGGGLVNIQCRECDHCGRWMRRVCHDRL